VENLKTGEIIKDDADILLSARGNLNDMAWPKIPGLKSFKGEVMHSAKWNQELASHHRLFNVS
jgi:cation diffusion facilitator CzcD-associated flavoprotein CzcO